jgi:hypothetical protein
MTPSPNTKAPTLRAASLNPDRKKAAYMQARMAGEDIPDYIVQAVLRAGTDGKAPPHPRCPPLRRL